ncbi:Adaptin N terminal region family protein [Trichomonas vaginalis G3]|uniref:Adaptin N terminal region family protein n=1 Tax=Trichomonas vaginalis (strain ATCC PRA-98 / G3) TaxID=412133 RepID=A2DJD5_TRIV3|nr:adaptor complex subunit beta family member family [Trichomonas vaginalis G3]EAY19522.1 Adaptin N terminal region family protein [Trichomonas vaginalis G3]KAI5519996.1 adaptor complex subunit beta family member family [Trichomonas vaginalis G3]|eukprot:XP_001580508.1 Adaptin N terminal region family protein [Trichomonas vaginalis G3]
MSRMQQAGEIQEMTMKLASPEQKDRDFAFQRLVALEAQNVDCSGAFANVSGYRTTDPKQEIKVRRFIGIYAERYVEAQPNLADLTVQLLMNEFEKPDPQMKGVVVRQIGRIINDANIDRLIPIVMRACSSDDPYVRKSAALSILSIHQSRASFVEKFKLGAQLKRLVEDSNPNVAANAISALLEINQSRDQPLFEPSFSTINNLLASIDQTTEWAQVQILDYTCNFKPDNANDARGIISRVSTRLSHANAAVILSAIRCCLQMNLYIDDPSKVRETLTRVALPLVTLLNNTAPVQYAAIKSILILLQHYRRLFSSEVSIFFCKFDDPPYIKLAKLDVILTLCSAQNVGKVLEELFDYAQQADVEFVRKSIAAIGKIAITFEAAASSCVDKIVALVDNKIEYVVQECIVVAADIFRRYPNQYLGILANICGALGAKLDDHRAKAAMVWIIGEYADRIGNAGDLLDAHFIDDFLEDTPDVQLAILTAVFKYFLVNQEDGQEMFQQVITMATSQVDNPSIRDRAFQYYWLISECPDYAQQVIMPEQKPLIKTELYSCDAELVKSLIPLVGTLSVLYNKKPQEFVDNVKIMSLASLGGDGGVAEGMNLPIVVDGKSSNSLEVRAALVQIGKESQITMRITNYNENADQIKDIAFNKNIFGYAPEKSGFPKELPSQKSISVTVSIAFDASYTQGAQTSSNLDVAILTNAPSPIIFHVPMKLETILVTDQEGGKFTREEFVKFWQSLPPSTELTTTVDNARVDSIPVAKNQFNSKRLYFNAKKDNTAYFSGKTSKGEGLVVFLSFSDGGRVQAGIRMQDSVLAPLILELVKNVIQ